MVRRSVGTPSSEEAPRVFVRAPKRYSAYRAFLKKLALAALARAKPEIRGDVTVVLTSDRAMRRLNHAYRGNDKPTDVLSFELGDGSLSGEPFGDVVISVDTAERQAREYSAALREEFARLLVHGVLHLCGHTHDESRAARRMHGLTRRIVAEFAS